MLNPLVHHFTRPFYETDLIVEKGIHSSVLNRTSSKENYLRLVRLAFPTSRFLFIPKFRFIHLVKHPTPCYEVDLHERNKPGLVQDLPSSITSSGSEYPDVVGDKRNRLEMRHEGVKAFEKGQKGCDAEGDL